MIELTTDWKIQDPIPIVEFHYHLIMKKLVLLLLLLLLLLLYTCTSPDGITDNQVIMFW